MNSNHEPVFLKLIEFFFPNWTKWHRREHVMPAGQRPAADESSIEMCKTNLHNYRPSRRGAEERGGEGTAGEGLMKMEAETVHRRQLPAVRPENLDHFVHLVATPLRWVNERERPTRVCGHVTRSGCQKPQNLQTLEISSESWFRRAMFPFLS